MNFSDVFLQVEISAESFLADGASIRFVVVVSVHVESEIINLVKSFVANVALECLLTRMGQSVVFVVSFLVETFSAEFANIRFVPHVDSHVSVEG